MNLKYILMELGNELVRQGAVPADGNRLRCMRACHTLGIPTVATEKYPDAIWRGDPGATLEPLVLFTEWLNAYPDARNALLELGVQWPITSPMK